MFTTYKLTAPIPIPRGGSRVRLMKTGLVRNIYIDTSWKVKDIENEITSVFGDCFDRHDGDGLPYHYLRWELKRQGWGRGGGGRGGRLTWDISGQPDTCKPCFASKPKWRGNWKGRRQTDINSTTDLPLKENCTPKWSIWHFSSTMKRSNLSNLAEQNEWNVCWCNQSQLRYSIIRVPQKYADLDGVVWSISQVILCVISKYYGQLLLWIADYILAFKLCKLVKVFYKSSDFLFVLIIK